MANQRGSSPDRGEAVNTAVPRQTVDIGLDYNKLPVPNGEIGSVDSAAFANAKVITLTDAKLVLDNFVETSRTRGTCEKHAGIQVNDEVHRVRDYCQNFAPRRPDASEQIVRKMVAERVTHPYYWALIMNLSPETMDEFVHLLPELDTTRKLCVQPRSPHPDKPFQTDEEIEALVKEMEAHRDGDY